MADDFDSMAMEAGSDAADRADARDNAKKRSKGLQRAAKGIQEAGKKQIERSTQEAASRTGQRGPQGEQRQVAGLSLPSFRKGGKVRKGQTVRLHKGERVRRRKSPRRGRGRM